MYLLIKFWGKFKIESFLNLLKGVVNIAPNIAGFISFDCCIYLYVSLILCLHDKEKSQTIHKFIVKTIEIDEVTEKSMAVDPICEAVVKKDKNRTEGQASWSLWWHNKKYNYNCLEWLYG